MSSESIAFVVSASCCGETLEFAFKIDCGTMVLCSADLGAELDRHITGESLFIVRMAVRHNANSGSRDSVPVVMAERQTRGCLRE